MFIVYGKNRGGEVIFERKFKTFEDALSAFGELKDTNEYPIIIVRNTKTDRNVIEYYLQEWAVS